MKKSYLLSKSEMKKVMGGGDPLVALCDHWKEPGGGGISHDDCMQCCAREYSQHYCNLIQGSICGPTEEPTEPVLIP